MRTGVVTVIALCFVIAISSALAGSGCSEAGHGLLNARYQQIAGAARVLKPRS